ncbi:hypothetical protein FKM82_007777 [Ascaphus truei]
MGICRNAESFLHTFLKEDKEHASKSIGKIRRGKNIVVCSVINLQCECNDVVIFGLTTL